MSTVCDRCRLTGTSGGVILREIVEDRAIERWGSQVPVNDVASQDQLHAVRSCLAGLAGALHVLADERLPKRDAARRSLEPLLLAEVERLQRLVAEPGAEDSPAGSAVRLDPIDVDEVIAGVALIAMMGGQHVFWKRTGTKVWGRRDDLVEVVSILLANADRHAGTPVRIDVATTDSEVCVSFTDWGPGVPVELRSEIFGRGARRSDSPGQGLGLSIAHDLVHGLGGRLVLDEDREGGARFTVMLPSIAKGIAA